MLIRDGALADLIGGTNLRVGEFSLVHVGPDEEDGQFSTRIVFDLAPEFFFEVTSGGSIDGCMVHAAPGQLQVEETRHIPHPEPRRGHLSDQVRNELQQWLRRLDVDLQNRATQRFREEAKAAVSELLEGMEETDDWFTREEAAEMQRRLDALEERMEALIRESAPDKRTADRQVASVHEDIEHLRRRTEQVNKAAWFRSMAQITTTWLAQPETRHFIEQGVEVIKGLLPGS